MNGFGLLLAELHKKERSACAKRSNLAGAVRFELTTKVLETHVLPLHHAPTFTASPGTDIIITPVTHNVNTFEEFFLEATPRNSAAP